MFESPRARSFFQHFNNLPSCRNTAVVLAESSAKPYASVQVRTVEDHMLDAQPFAIRQLDDGVRQLYSFEPGEPGRQLLVSTQPKKDRSTEPGSS